MRTTQRRRTPRWGRRLAVVVLALGVLVMPSLALGAGGTIIEMPLLSNSTPQYVTTSTHPTFGPEVWTTQLTADIVSIVPGSLSGTASLREFFLPSTVVTQPAEIAAYQDSAYFTGFSQTHVYQLFDAGNSGALVDYALPIKSHRYGVAMDQASGQPWFSEYDRRAIATFTGGAWVEYFLPVVGNPVDLAVYDSPSLSVPVLVAFVIRRPTSSQDVIGVLDPLHARMGFATLPATSSGAIPHALGITYDAMGGVWFTEPGMNAVVRMSPIPLTKIVKTLKTAPKAAKYPVPVRTAPLAAAISSVVPPMDVITPTVAAPFTVYPLPIASSRPLYVAAPPQNTSVYFTAPGGQYVGRLNWLTSTEVTLEPFTLAPTSLPWGITNGFMGSDVYFAERGRSILGNIR